MINGVPTLVWVTTPEIYDPFAPVQSRWSNFQLFNSPPTKIGYYPFMFVLPDGKLFMAGPEVIQDDPNFAATDTLLLDISATQPMWTKFPSTGSPFQGGSATMYEPGKVFKSGGVIPNDTTQNENRAAYIDTTAQTPVWTLAPTMAYRRKFHNTTMLPDGKILITGGTSVRNLGANAVYAAELYDPANGFARRTLASASRKRTYHSTVQIMKDAKVLSAGGEWSRVEGGGDVYDDENHEAEIFTPPYLQTGVARPTIDEAQTPSDVTIKTWFNIYTPDVNSIKKIAWIRLGAVTHAFDQDARYVPGPAEAQWIKMPNANPPYIRIQAPTTPKIAPYCWYMLFIMKEVTTSLGTEYVPSVAKYIRIDPPEIGIEPETRGFFEPVVSAVTGLFGIKDIR